jgi:glucose/arabinose dehydrogenase
VPFANGRPNGQPVDVLTGFLSGDEEALGRPVGVAIDRKGALLVADDVGKTIWRVTPAGSAPATRGRPLTRADAHVPALVTV